MSPSELQAYLLNGAEEHHFNGVKRWVRKRDNKQCVICGKTEDLTVAHLIHREGSPDLRYNDPYNLITLCAGCHKRVDGEAEPRIHVLRWNPEDELDGLRVGIETLDGGIVPIAKPKLAFYAS